VDKGLFRVPGAAKAPVTVRIGRHVSASGATHIERPTVPRAPTLHSLLAGIETGRITPGRFPVVGWIVPVGHPFPCIAGHIQGSIRTGPLRVELPTGAVYILPSYMEVSLHLNQQFLSHKFTMLPTNMFPHGYIRPSVPRAAFSHSASVGSRLPAHSQDAEAYCHFTPLLYNPVRTARGLLHSFHSSEPPKERAYPPCGKKNRQAITTITTSHIHNHFGDNINGASQRRSASLLSCSD
jgi:hypothetical protein